MTTPKVSPSSRDKPFVASVGGSVLLWGGLGDTEPDKVFAFSVETEAWMKKLTKGPHPPAGLSRGGCSASGHNVYLYGGCDGSWFLESRFHGSLFKLSTDDWTWKELCRPSVGGPGRKDGCRVITYKKWLLLAGGYCPVKPISVQPGSSYDGPWTNELHCFNLTAELWSNPSMSGSRPPPCAHFSLTKTDEEHAVMFGGCGPSSGRCAYLHFLYLPTMTWTQVQHKVGDPWPKGRSHHIAVCLGYGGQHKTVLISGGVGGFRASCKVHGDMWLLDPASGTWKELQMQKKHAEITARYAHSAAAVSISSECIEVVLFGGSKTHHEQHIADSVQPIADTAVLRFELQNAPSSSGKEWSLTDVADHTQLGSSDRLVAKRRLMKASNRSKDIDESVQELEQQLQEYKARVEQYQQREEEIQKRVNELERRAEESEWQKQQLEVSLTEKSERLRECEEELERSNSHWIVRREEVDLTGPELGRGAWATVTVARFRGVQVAVKRIHGSIVFQHNIELFQREMSIAARLRHPNLVQFIGATVEGEMMILMELMTTSLRSQLEKDEYFQPSYIKSICLDIAQGLSYLHQMKPNPIVHRDISSANVLLEDLPHRNWKAKLTDYGSVNIICQLHTENPGSPAYAAPEASNPCLQSPKMDIFSFGALLLEMLTGQLPAPDDRRKLLCRVHHKKLLALIRRCLKEKKEERPNATDIVSELSQ